MCCLLELYCEPGSHTPPCALVFDPVSNATSTFRSLDVSHCRTFVATYVVCQSEGIHFRWFFVVNFFFLSYVDSLCICISRDCWLYDKGISFTMFTLLLLGLHSKILDKLNGHEYGKDANSPVVYSGSVLPTNLHIWLRYLSWLRPAFERTYILWNVL